MEKEEKTQSNPPPVDTEKEGETAEQTEPAAEFPEDSSHGLPDEKSESSVGGDETSQTDGEAAAQGSEGATAEAKPGDSLETDVEKKKKSLFTRGKETLVRWKNALFEAVSERSAEVKHAKAKRILVAVALGLIVVFFIAFYFTVGKKIALFINKPEEFREWIEGFDKGSIVIFICLRVVQTVLKLIPGEALEIAAGCAFGVWGGLLWCLIGSVIGSFIIIFLGKRYGMKLVGLFVSPEKMQSLAFLKNKKRLNFTFFLLYFIPGTPKDMFTWLVCLTDENVFLFVLITSLARIPSIVTSTWCGQELVNENYLLSVGILAGTILLSVGGGLLYKFVLDRRKKKLAPEGGGDAGAEKISEENGKK